GYSPSETVDVSVTGPNGYTASCAGIVDENGAWSCQVELWNNELAVGDYSYIAKGQESNVEESGTFKDGISDVSGNVKDASTNAPISGATVSCSNGCNGTFSTTTDVFGDYSVLVKIILNINNYISQMRLANSSGDNPGIGSP
ncbi:MAG TPA: carboxypeptidase-like regulatory domain-containing protein, partial [Planococcus sp. (in: firmicutes)]|nr:carboxypeptidase-like regulatory domain-containing protein [Planococcus sp. (in: firmicutes)]